MSVEMRKKLMSFLESSDLYEATLVLELMPANYLLKERALLLAKLKRYKEAMAICVD